MWLNEGLLERLGGKGPWLEDVIAEEGADTIAGTRWRLEVFSPNIQQYGAPHSASMCR